MNYVVTEDKKSGFYIWNAIIKSASKNVSVVSAGGKDQLYYKVRGLPLKQGDAVLIAIDDIGESVRHIMVNIREYCTGCGVRVDFTAYYCIEEAMISYSKWVYRCPNVPTANSTNTRDMQCYNAFSAIRRCIINGIAYDPLDMAECKEFIRDYKLFKSTKEEILAKVLGVYTKNNNYWVGSNKDISKCWLASCCNNDDVRKAKYFCSNNKNINKSETLKEKMVDLCSKSMLYREVHKI
jgi:hypothetical protein